MISGSLWRQTNRKRAKQLLGMVRSAALCKGFGEVRQLLAPRWSHWAKAVCVARLPWKTRERKELKSLKTAPRPSQGWKSLLVLAGIGSALVTQLGRGLVLGLTTDMTQASQCPLGHLSLCARWTVGTGPSAWKVMCNSRMGWKLTQCLLLSSGLIFMGLGHDTSKENTVLIKTYKCLMSVVPQKRREKTPEEGRLLVPNL